MRTSSQFLIVLFFGFSFMGFAQQGATPAQITPPAERPSTLAQPANRRITLDAVVTDHSGKAVPGLQQQDFTLLDNKQPQKILSFRAVDGTSKPADPPSQAILLVDAVNTLFDVSASQWRRKAASTSNSPTAAYFPWASL